MGISKYNFSLETRLYIMKDNKMPKSFKWFNNNSKCIAANGSMKMHSIQAIKGKFIGLDLKQATT